jgi:uncharacterized protein involved in exopolysaccharide biosynthesis
MPAPSAEPPSEPSLTYLDYFAAIGRDLMNLARTILGEWRAFYFTLALATVAGIFLALFSTPVYRARVVLAPQTSTDGSSLGSMVAGRLGGGLSSLAGLGGDQQAEGLAVQLQSRALLYQFINRYHVQRQLFPDLWDDANQRWLRKPIGKVAWVRQLLTGEREKVQYGPTLEDAYIALTGKLNVSVDSQANLIDMSLDWKDPKVGADWANGIVKLLNDQARNRTVSSSSLRVKYLQAQISAAASVETRSAMINLIQTNIETIAAARSESEFALQIIDPAVSTGIPVWPKPLLILVLSVIVGSLLGGIVALTWRSMRNAGRLSRWKFRSRHLVQQEPNWQ